MIQNGCKGRYVKLRQFAAAFAALRELVGCPWERLVEGSFVGGGGEFESGASGERVGDVGVAFLQLLL